MINIIESEVQKLLSNNNDGHGFDHIQRVRDLALQFSTNENVNKDIIEIACLLHDVDDYKLFGQESANKLLNANRILDQAKINGIKRSKILDIIKTIGFSKRLEGIKPETLEGEFVSDADMCDAIGANGILRTYRVSLSKNSLFFNKQTSLRLNISSISEYKNNKSEHTVQHFFDKLLIINSLLMTVEGKKEGQKRQQIMIDFLQELFREEGSVEWAEYLEEFTDKLAKS